MNSLLYSVIFRNFAFVIELDRHLEILLLSNDCVIVPNFGGFMAHHVEARKDGEDGMLLPPSRTIGFNPKLTINDSLLAQSYVECYDISYPEALVRIEDEVRELVQHLENDGSYELHGIGVVSLNGEGCYEFDPCEAGVLTPSLYGLSGFEMLSLRELNAKDEMTNLQKQQTVKLVDLDHVLGDTAIDDNEDKTEKAPEHVGVTLWRTIAAACIVALAFLLYPSSLDNNRQLLTASAINVELLQRVLPKTDMPSEGATVDGSGWKQQAAKPDDTSTREKAIQAVPQEGYVIVLASRVSLGNAKAYVKRLNKLGYTEAKVVDTTRNTKVVYGFYANQEEAYRALRSFRKNTEFAEAWVMKHHQ